MEISYTYIDSLDYIDQLRFDYIESYSFQRGSDYEENLKLSSIEYDNLKAKIVKQENLTEPELKRLAELEGLLGFTQYLINDQGVFHPSCQKINILSASDPLVDRLKTILQTEIKYKPALLCAPTYRDAIVFYDNNRGIVSTLNVCLSCYYMETKKFSHVNGDFETYDLLKRLFIEMGHDVENPEYFIMDDLRKQKAKYDKC